MSALRGRSIGMDARMWSHAGIGRYIREIAGRVAPAAGARRFVLFGGPALKRDGVPRGAEYREATSRIYGIGEQLEMAAAARDLDLLHVPHFNVPVLRSKPFVVTVHDLIYLHDRGASNHPFGQAYVKFLLGAIRRRAAAIITVSESTKRDLLERVRGLDPERVSVTYEAASSVFGPIDDAELLAGIRRRLGLERPFVLFVGSLKPHKNVPTLVEAVEKLRLEKRLDHELVLVGRSDPKNKALAAMLREYPFVRHLGEVSDDDLVPLYNLADAFVLPSFREGFGLPVLEAMACGTPVLVANRSSLPEVAGEAGLVFDPHSVDALTELLYNVLINRSLRENMSRAGLERARRFTWEAAAEQTLGVYERALS